MSLCNLKAMTYGIFLFALLRINIIIRKIQEAEFMEKVRKICKGFWKRCYIYIPLLFIIFFSWKYGQRYFYLNELKEECTINSENSPEEYIELMMMIYDNFSQEYIQRDSLIGGIVNGIVDSMVCIYIIFLTSLILSEKAIWREIGVVLIVISLTLIALYLYFVFNFTLVF